MYDLTKATTQKYARKLLLIYTYNMKENFDVL